MIKKGYEIFLFVAITKYQNSVDGTSRDIRITSKVIRLWLVFQIIYGSILKCV